MKRASVGAAARLHRPYRSRQIGFLLGALALGLLIAFYSVVSHAVERGKSMRQQAQLAHEREAVCSVFSRQESRDLCLLTVSDLAARQALARASAQLRLSSGSAAELTAAAY